MSRASIAVLLVLATASAASAQDPLAEAREAFERAEFAAAVEAFDRVAAGDGLTRAALLDLLRGRALARHAALDAAGAEQDLVALASLEPQAELGDMAPPALQRAFERLRGEIREPLAIEATVERIPDGALVRARVTGDVARLVRDVRVAWRDGGEWREASGEEVRVLAGPSLEYVVEAIGPGGAVLASSGTREEPRVHRATLEAEPEPTPSGDDDVALVVGLSVGAAVVLATVAVVLAVVLSPGGVQPSAPMER